MRRRTRRYSVAIVSTALVLSTAAVAVAIWSVGGAGAGGATPGRTAPVTLSAGTVSAELYPASSATVTAVANNPNATAVRIEALALDTTSGIGGFTIVGDTPAGGCSPTSFSFAPQSTGWSIPASGSSTISLPNSITMASSAANACQGATITVFLKANG